MIFEGLTNCSTEAWSKSAMAMDASGASPAFPGRSLLCRSPRTRFHRGQVQTPFDRTGRRATRIASCKPRSRTTSVLPPAWCGADMSASRRSATELSHADAIDALVAETERPLEEVAEIYMRELARLREGARVQDYLVLLTRRHVRHALRGSGRGPFLKPVALTRRHLGWPTRRPPVQTAT